MTRVYIADARTIERSALRLMLLDLNMEIAGEANSWLITVADVPICRTDMLIVDWELLPSAPNAALDALRRLCPRALVIILISGLLARQQAAVSVGADMFIGKDELPERVAQHLLAAAGKIRP